MKIIRTKRGFAFTPENDIDSEFLREWGDVLLLTPWYGDNYINPLLREIEESNHG